MKKEIKHFVAFLKRMVIEAIQLFSKIIERPLTKKFSNKKLKKQPVFIIGAPRTGSTIIYQILTNQFNVLYFDNLVCLFNKIPFIGFILSNLVFKNCAHNCFKSHHGDTQKYGWHAPSECGAFWYRWLPKDRHFVDYSDINKLMVKQIRTEINAIINYFDKPLVFKNLNAGQRLRLIKKCFPDAKFIYIKRDPLYVAQSILTAKRKIGIKDNEFWSIMPPNVADLKKLNGYEQIVKQIYFLQKQIEEDLQLFPEENILKLEYKNSGSNLNKIIVKCKKLLGANYRKNFKKADIKISERISLDKKEIAQIESEIEKLNW
jgi:hypothetical protein